MDRDQLVSAARPYWSVGVLGAGAVLLLLFGDVPEVSAALAGAAIVRAFDVREPAVRDSQRRADEEKRERERKRQDLDETRRVAYIALLSSGVPNPDLIATLVNSLAHHGLGVDPEEASNQTALALRGNTEGRNWLQTQIDRIETELRQLG